jgi:hypothetical protein
MAELQKKHLEDIATEVGGVISYLAISEPASQSLNLSRPHRSHTENTPRDLSGLGSLSKGVCPLVALIKRDLGPAIG